MKFKPTILKIIISIIIAVLFFIWYNSQIICDKGKCYQEPLIISFVLVIIIYVFWSLLQKD